VKDFFHEPAKGITISPQEFFVGVGKGSFSLAKNSVFALFGSASKMTSGIGSGMSLTEFD
jgi:hypothetical protein